MTTEPALSDQNGLSSAGGKGDTNANNNANSAKRGGRSAKRSIPSPITSAKSNPAADNRNMRRIIAEDPDWSLATVPLLTELCATHIVTNFAGTYKTINHIKSNLSSFAFNVCAMLIYIPCQIQKTCIIAVFA